VRDACISVILIEEYLGVSLKMDWDHPVLLGVISLGGDKIHKFISDVDKSHSP
jgi:hypothetical protein